MLILARRVLVIAALMFWSGGFVFYASVVVPIGTDVLGGATQQGFITREVARRINWAGTAALVIFAWDAAVMDAPPWQRRLRWAAIAVVAICLAVLYFLHARMDALMPATSESALLDYEAFDNMHRIYLWTITLQWAASIGYMVLTLAVWRQRDRSLAD